MGLVVRGEGASTESGRLRFEAARDVAGQHPYREPVLNLSAMDAGEIMEAGDQDALMARNGANGQLVRGLEETPAAPLKGTGEAPAR